MSQGQAESERGALGQARISLGAALRPGSDRTVIALYAITILLVGFGLIMVLSSSSITSYLDDQGFFGGFWRQATFAIIGLPIMLLAAALPVTFWKRWAWWLLGLGIVLQLLVFTPLGVEVWGNRNWIQIGGFSAQPSEALKLALVVWVGAVLLRKEPLLGQMKHELIPVIIPGAVLALGVVLLGRDLGTVLIMAAMVFGAMYFGGISGKTLAVIAAGGLLAVFFFVITSQNRLDRLFGHAGGNTDYSGLAWQPLHGLWALAGGGLFGVGLGGSKAKWSWLPAADNDYIFAIIGEELGLVGGLLVIGLFVALTVVMLRVITRARDRFGKAVVGGILVWIVGQAFVNIGVVIGILPVLGVPLPLISSGGTALIACLAAIGVVVSIARDGTMYQAELAEAEAGRTNPRNSRTR
ncbi:FtsW/RodA/SpoVE family cell cycle protein [Leucobacter luti]|uniref:Probable peptidoglycan glycosyltransferase FtsW n=1 Tax=Leucobacter luti TaxID=340320 RepID=A0A4R6RZP2_9MICO|nr:putative peptidoglycan glycosyltransferase FtsW [Leucobacter luti]MCW2287572.1 cell division protein FtsW [Leucobacter luti]QYM76395.1 putative lipid II flippase FtsW [Leucobacter luti]TCK46260.1 cell division-specific peptidoglycan biosynthesis regulator FtsW [Leucobacter luti]TDP92689.1 cell division-specific peptidoglycan biosynthesis regulator FtsW [Leucobacter luti]